MKKTAKAPRANASEIKVAVIGGSGYVGEELVRLLLRHPYADLVAITSRQFAGKTLDEIFPRLSHHSNADELRVTAPDLARLAPLAQVIFLGRWTFSSISQTSGTDSFLWSVSFTDADNGTAVGRWNRRANNQWRQHLD